MSITAIYSVFCDYVPDEGEACTEWIAETLSKRSARAEARLHGWSTSRDMDLCPRHHAFRDLKGKR